MKEADLPQVLALQQELKFQDWNAKQFLSEICADYALCIVYETDIADKIAGYAIFHLLGADSELLSIATAPDFQRSGIGTSLLQAGCKKLNFEAGDQIFLEVREGNEHARAFYEKHLFEAYSIRKKYYSDGENAILYKKSR